MDWTGLWTGVWIVVEPYHSLVSRGQALSIRDDNALCEYMVWQWPCKTNYSPYQKIIIKLLDWDLGPCIDRIDSAIRESESESIQSAWPNAIPAPSRGTECARHYFVWQLREKFLNDC